jgi:hypothetical protein
MRFQEVAQLAETTPKEAKVSSSNLPPSSYADMSQKKKKKNCTIHYAIESLQGRNYVHKGSTSHFIFFIG